MSKQSETDHSLGIKKCINKNEIGCINLIVKTDVTMSFEFSTYQVLLIWSPIKLKLLSAVKASILHFLSNNLGYKAWFVTKVIHLKMKLFAGGNTRVRGMQKLSLK